ncbi:MAG: hypothetical protein ABI147_06785 [Acidobacteriaceae bacterium]
MSENPDMGVPRMFAEPKQIHDFSQLSQKLSSRPEARVFAPEWRDPQLL